MATAPITTATATTVTTATTTTRRSIPVVSMATTTISMATTMRKSTPTVSMATTTRRSSPHGFHGNHHEEKHPHGFHGNHHQDKHPHGFHGNHNDLHGNHHQDKHSNGFHGNHNDLHGNHHQEKHPHGFHGNHNDLHGNHHQEKHSHGFHGNHDPPDGFHGNGSAALLGSRLEAGNHGNHYGNHGNHYGGFRVAFPLRTNYMFARVRGPVRSPLGAISVCLWLRPGGAPARAPPAWAPPSRTPRPGQPNELVLLAWAGRPLQLLVDDQAAVLSLSPHPGQVAAPVRHLGLLGGAPGGASRTGVPRGRGEGLAPGHPLRPHGVLVLGQEQDALGGRFDATQAFVGELAELHLWSRALAPPEVAALARCASPARGDLLAWAQAGLELHGGVTTLPFQPCT
ncbi:neuronal pentraxin-1-like [Passer domesticus]|uniref:neuronal pentraxin-1-like n=1 Tax=Passer domesticus TaxID=48849 RepID=UPI0030FE9EDF